MLPNLSRLRLHAKETPSTEYQASNKCPEPAGAGDLREGVNVQSGSSPPFQLATDPITAILYRSQNPEIDWENGTQDLAKPTTFVHVATAGLPVDLREGTKLRTQLRTYAHTDIKNWTWNGGDRVIIHWPPGMPFQIMGTLNNSDVNNTPYQRSCKLLSNDRPVVLEPNEQGEVTWPYANVAIVLPPAFYSVMGTPRVVRTPKQVVADTFQLEGSKSVVDAARGAVEMPQLQEHKWNRNVTVFTSPSEEDLIVIFRAFERLNAPYQQYEMSLTSEVSDAQKKRKAALVAVGIASSNLTYKLTVSRTCMYQETHVQAHYIDLSWYVRAGDWRPKDWAFYNPYKNVKNRTENAVVLLKGSLKMQVYLEMWMYAEDDAMDNLRIAYDDTLLDDTLDMNTVQLQTFTPMQLREAFAAEFRDQASPDQQTIVVKAFIRRFQTLANENEAGDLDYETFAARSEYLAVAASKLLPMVGQDALNVQVRDMTRPVLSYDYPRTLAEVLKQLIDMTGDGPIVDTLLQAVSRYTVQKFKDQLFKAFDRDGDDYWMREMMNKHKMIPPRTLGNDLYEDDEEDL